MALAAVVSSGAHIRGVCCASVPVSDIRDSLLSSITSDAAVAHIGFLADDALEGRKAGSLGSRVAAAYIVSQLRQYGVRPLSDSYMQPFSAYSAERQKRRPYYVEPDSIAKLPSDTRRRLDMANVIGYVPGVRSNEYVVVGAHFDHLGTDPSLEGDIIYNGADDNASGVSAVLQIARAFALSGVRPLRNIVFAFWDGEESGLLGSRYFVRNCSFTDSIRCYLNFDMIGRNNKPDNPRHVVYFYTSSHPLFASWVKDDIAAFGLRLEPDYREWEKPVFGSDNASFALRDIPVIWYHTDGHPDYHQPGDEAGRINYEKVVDITKAAFLSVWNLANEDGY